MQENRIFPTRLFGEENRHVKVWRRSNNSSIGDRNVIVKPSSNPPWYD
ncbi:hypothetical protein O9929_09095 [Vibrio lentus]|nr:hypothetical protein [Vibrio lentus]